MGARMLISAGGRNDLAGRLLAQNHLEWQIIRLPALAEDNDLLGRAPDVALWPEWEDIANLERKRRAVGPRDWSALYQQRPAPEEGDYFKKEWLKPYDTAPARATMRVYGGSDYAGPGGDSRRGVGGIAAARLLSPRAAAAHPAEVSGDSNAAYVDGRSVTIGLPEDPGQAGTAQVYLG
jgi:hypothetical protein